jgi:hypothetical protein
MLKARNRKSESHVYQAAKSHGHQRVQTAIDSSPAAKMAVQSNTSQASSTAARASHAQVPNGNQSQNLLENQAHIRRSVQSKLHREQATEKPVQNPLRILNRACRPKNKRLL